MIEDSVYFKTIDAAFPNLGKKIALFWVHPELTALLHELQHDTSARPRAGFPAPVLMAIHALAIEHDALYPHLARKDANLWHLSGALP